MIYYVLYVLLFYYYTVYIIRICTSTAEVNIFEHTASSILLPMLLANNFFRSTSPVRPSKTIFSILFV